MATLVLSAVGSIIGGPIGATIGAVIGQQIDQRVFAPKGRDGPRLGDLSVQTSSYATQIPKLFGRTRVSGTVIWATDLREERQRVSAGKGRPKQTTYSYSASFAVALSARRVGRIGRIWADGKLLRGEAGDFKTQTQFRFYTGNEAQSLDPLIASAEGAGLSPAYRGLAYAVFEDLALADFGNRIPSISFEVIADEGDISLSTIAESLTPELRGSACPTSVAGFVAKGDSVRSVLAALDVVVPLHVRTTGHKMTLAEVGVVVPNPARDDLGAAQGEERKALFETERPSSASIPSRLSLAYAAPERDYQPGLERVRREAPGRREEVVALPLTLTPQQASALAERAMAARWSVRATARIAVPWRFLTIVPGALLVVPGLSGRWMVSARSLSGMVVTLDLVRPPETLLALSPADAGRGVFEVDQIHGPTTLVLLDLPVLDGGVVAAPIVVAAAAGVSPGWRSAALLQSVGNGASWQEAGPTAPSAILGHSVSVLPPGTAFVVDRVNTLDVQLLNTGMSLHAADDDGLLNGVNLAAVGQELIQFQSATLLAPGHYRLSGLLRGRGGTEWAMRGHSSAEPFVLLDRTALLPLNVLANVPSVRVLASGVGDVTSPAEASLSAPGSALLPPAPAHLRQSTQNGNAVFRWTRRSRNGWGWADYVDAPLVEESERYRVVVMPDIGLQRSFEVATASWTYTATDRANDVAAGAQMLTLSVSQIGNHGASKPTSLTLSLT
jgi:Putative phage tail protein